MELHALPLAARSYALLIYTIVGVSVHLPLQRATSRLTTPVADPGRVPGVVWVHSQTFMHASTRDWEQDKEDLHNLPSWSENPYVTLVWEGGGGIPSTSHYNTLDHIKQLCLQSKFPLCLHKVLVLSLPPVHIKQLYLHSESPHACIKSLFSLYPLPCPSNSWAHTLSQD